MKAQQFLYYKLGPRADKSPRPALLSRDRAPRVPKIISPPALLKVRRVPSSDLCVISKHIGAGDPSLKDVEESTCSLALLPWLCSRMCL